jgi:hypothetical protein
MTSKGLTVFRVWDLNVVEAEDEPDAHEVSARTAEQAAEEFAERDTNALVDGITLWDIAVVNTITGERSRVEVRVDFEPVYHASRKRPLDASEEAS